MSRRRWNRRGFLLWVATPALPLGIGGRRNGRRRAPRPSTPEPWELDRDTLLVLARTLLPDELGDSGRAAAVDDFLAWLRGYRADAELGHGYGFTRVRYSAPHPGPRYREEIAELDAAARRRHGSPLVEIGVGAARDLVTERLEEIVDAEGGLPGRPGAGHVTIDLMASWFGSPEATDRCYGKAIRRETCRGLFTDVEALPPFDDREGR